MLTTESAPTMPALARKAQSLRRRLGELTQLLAETDDEAVRRDLTSAIRDASTLLAIAEDRLTVPSWERR